MSISMDLENRKRRIKDVQRKAFRNVDSHDQIIYEQSATAWTLQDVHLLTTIVYPQLKHLDKFPCFKRKTTKLL